MPKIRVFSYDNVELKPCYVERALNLVRSNKAFFSLVGDTEVVVVIKKCSGQALEQVLEQDDKAV